jgi:hypothetical protein
MLSIALSDKSKGAPLSLKAAGTALALAHRASALLRIDRDTTGAQLQATEFVLKIWTSQREFLCPTRCRLLSSDYCPAEMESKR